MGVSPGGEPLIRRQSAWSVLLLIVVAGLTGYYLGLLGLVPPGYTGPLSGAGSNRWSLLEQVRLKVAQQYVEPVADGELVQGAIRGLVEATGDKYSLYMDRDQYAKMLASLSDRFGGVGIELELRDGVVVVISPIQGTPGAAAGIKPGDQIIAVDHKPLYGLNLFEVANLIRGPTGTQVSLRLRRGQREFIVTLTRADIPVPQLNYRLLESGSKIGYLHLYQFNSGLGARVQAALADLERQGMQGLILDLRQNPGGLLTEAVAVADQFVPAGPVVYVVGRNGEREVHAAAGPGFNLPLAVLIDQGSASASEIVAGAIRDRRAGTLVGSTTYGKASVQNIFHLANGAGLKLTTARYLTAGGFAIDGKGIPPDVEVAAAPDLALALDDPVHPQLARAIELINAKIR